MFSLASSLLSSSFAFWVGFRVVVASFGALRLSLVTSGGLSLSRFGLDASFAVSGGFALSARFAA
ncbi:MAG TPA: hypothetical protein DCQ67_10025, partial [Acidimicrobiaceae bacterium]|nr:hypothetical protein [Acidimicrobiaceae bacterium]